MEPMSPHFLAARVRPSGRGLLSLTPEGDCKSAKAGWCESLPATANHRLKPVADREPAKSRQEARFIRAGPILP